MRRYFGLRGPTALWGLSLVNKDKLDPTGDPAVFAALSEEIGRPINEYAFGDIPQLAKNHGCGPGLGRITF
jgi:hypothetical protein